MIQVPPLITPVTKPLIMPRKHPALLDPSCVAYYDFSRGPKLQDFSGKGNHGTINGATSVAKGRHGTALSFDALDDYIDCGNDNSLTPDNDFTLMAWIKGKGTELYLSIISKGGYLNGGYQMFLQAGTLRGSIGDDNISHNSGSADLRDSKWHHVALTFLYVSAVISFYVDGEPKNTRTSLTKVLSSAEKLTIGRSAAGGTAQYFDGLIDMAGVYTKALSTNEIKRLYETGR